MVSVNAFKPYRLQAWYNADSDTNQCADNPYYLADHHCSQKLFGNTGQNTDLLANCIR